MLFIGIDPGRNGAICEFDDLHERITLTKMDLDVLKEKIEEWRLGFPNIYLEKAQAMPYQGVSSMFSYGRHFGHIEGLLSGAGLSFDLVAPQTWTKVITREHKGENGKERALEAVKFLFPDVNLLATNRSKKPHDGFIDALLIAEYGRRTTNGIT